MTDDNVNIDILYDYMLEDHYLEMKLNRLKEATFAKIMTHKNIRLVTQTQYNEGDIERFVAFHVNQDTEYTIKQQIIEQIDQAIATYRENEVKIFRLNEEQIEALVNEIYSDIFDEITHCMYYCRIEGIEA